MERHRKKPTGKIKISENSWKAFLNNITFGLFFKDTQTVTINAADNSGEAVTVEYLLSAKELTKAELDGMTFTAYTAPFGIDPDNEYIIYVRLTDKAGNTDYICSDGIVLDGTSPVITGIENGKTYCEAQTINVDEKYVNTVTVNGKKFTLDESGSFTLAPADGEQKIVVTDKAGNTAEMTVTVNDGHTFGEWTSNGDGTHTRQCTADGCTEGVETDNCTDEDKNHICDICGNIISNHEDANQDHVCDRVVRSGGGSGFYSYPPDRATRMTAYRPVLEIALAYGMEYPQNYMKAVTLNLNGGSVGGNTGDISIVVKNIEVLDPSYPAVTFLAPTKEGLTRPDGNTGTYFMWRGDNGELYAPGDAVPNEVNSLTALWVEHGHCVCGGDADFDGHTSHTAVEWTAWDKTDSLPTTAGNYYLKNDILIDGQFEINESVNICLNGKKIRAGSSIPENRYMLTVKGSNALTITDCGGNGTIVGADTKRYLRHTGRDPHYVRGTIRDFLCGVGVSGTFRMTGNAHITACRESGISCTAHMEGARRSTFPGTPQ